MWLQVLQKKKKNKLPPHLIFSWSLFFLILCLISIMIDEDHLVRREQTYLQCKDPNLVRNTCRKIHYSSTSLLDSFL